jgi:hypothetical protein
VANGLEVLQPRSKGEHLAPDASGLGDHISSSLDIGIGLNTSEVHQRFSRQDMANHPLMNVTPNQSLWGSALPPRRTDAPGPQKAERSPSADFYLSYSMSYTASWRTHLG